jgi:osmoprotectant transport system permease protein
MNVSAATIFVSRGMTAMGRFYCGLLVLGTLLAALPLSREVFMWLFPQLERPLYEQHGFLQLLVEHLVLVAASSVCAVIIGVGAGIIVTRPSGREFRRLAVVLTAMGQSFPPVAVLALAVPLIGFGFWPAFVALALYGVLPICENTMAGLEAVSADVKDAGRGLGMTPNDLLRRIELPLAAPIVLAGIRTSVTINISTAAIASTVGAVSLGSPIIIGLNGNNIAYVLQGAVLVSALAVVVDLGFEALVERSQRWRAT